MLDYRDARIWVSEGYGDYLWSKDSRRIVREDGVHVRASEYWLGEGGQWIAFCPNKL